LKKLERSAHKLVTIAIFEKKRSAHRPNPHTFLRKKRKAFVIEEGK